MFNIAKKLIKHKPLIKPVAWRVMAGMEVREVDPREKGFHGIMFDVVAL